MTLPIFQRTITDEAGNVIANATVEVRLESTGLLATIYSDRAGAVTITNPLTTGADGFAQFYAAAGDYRIKATDPVSGDIREWRYEPIFSPDADITTSTGTQPLAVAFDDRVTNSFMLDTVLTRDSVGANTTEPSINSGRTPWTALMYPTAIDVTTMDLDLSHNWIHPDNDGSAIYNARPGYYSKTGPDAELSHTIAGDNLNEHSAGIIFCFHGELIKDDLGVGDHGAIFGGSWKRVAGSYSGSFAGQIHEVFGIYSVAIGGQYIRLGTKSDVAPVRRSGTLGGLDNYLESGQESGMIGGFQNYMAASRSAILGGLECSITGSTSGILSGNRNSAASFGGGIVGGQDNTINAAKPYSGILAGELNTIDASYSAIIAGNSNKTVADYSVARGRDAIADVYAAEASSSGSFSAAGDNQSYRINAQRSFTGSFSDLGITDGSGGSLFAPPSNSIVTINIDINCMRTDVVGETASFNIKATFANIAGTLTLKGEDKTVIHRDAVGYDVTAVVGGGGTLITVQVTNNASNTVRWTACGNMLVQRL